MNVDFVKMHGAGNDFILLDNRRGDIMLDDYRTLAAMSDRHTGIGCEGFIAIEHSATCDFRMRFYNPDGGEAEFCGNGVRCAAAFARACGAAKADEMTIETRSGAVAARILDAGTVSVKVPTPHDFGDDFVIAGVPHKIVPVENLAKVDVRERGRAIRMSAEFAPGGTNVDFVVYRQPHRVSIRTYERGVEDETGACGSGAVAAAVIGVRDYSLEFPVSVKTALGFELTVDGKFDGEMFSDIELTGPVVTVFHGELDLESLSGTIE